MTSWFSNADFEILIDKEEYDLLDEILGSTNNINPVQIISSLQTVTERDVGDNNSSAGGSHQGSPAPSSVTTDGDETVTPGKKRNGRTHNPKKRKHIDERVTDLLKEKWIED